MQQGQRKQNNIRMLTAAALVAAMYVILTYASELLGLGGKGLFQCRLSEALCILPYFTAAAIPGLGVGCLLAGLLTAAAIPDLLFGTLATVLGAIGARLVRRVKLLTPLPSILSNTLILPFVIRYSYLGNDVAYPVLVLSVLIGELLSCGVLGTLLLFALEKRKAIPWP